MPLALASPFVRCELPRTAQHFVRDKRTERRHRHRQAIEDDLISVVGQLRRSAVLRPGVVLKKIGAARGREVRRQRVARDGVLAGGVAQSERDRAADRDRKEAGRREQCKEEDVPGWALRCKSKASA